MAEHSNVRLSLANTAENVAVVRTVLAGLADSADLDPGEFNDIRTAVSEACNNVVLHAYEGELGAMDVAIELGKDSIQVSVRDHGLGIEEQALDDGAESPGIGLHVIRTLAQRTSIDRPPGAGTRVSMEFLARGVGALSPRLRSGPDLDLSGMPRFAAAISIAPVSLARRILPRLAYTLAARAHFSTDRLSDVQLLADALSEHALQAVCEQHVSLGIGVQPRDLRLSIAPLRIGHGQRLLGASDLDGLGRVIEKLADRHDIDACETHETLALSMHDHR
ncbi:MAG: ATP-binding protein [Solirubrobacteraceae bacterium]